MTIDHLKEVAPLQTLSDNAESVGKLIVERILVAENVGMVYTGQDSDFVEAIR